MICQPGREKRVLPDEFPYVEARRVDVHETRGRSHHVVDTYVVGCRALSLPGNSADLNRLHRRPFVQHPLQERAQRGRVDDVSRVT